jgi:hypothetical protein
LVPARADTQPASAATSRCARPTWRVRTRSLC